MPRKPRLPKIVRDLLRKLSGNERIRWRDRFLRLPHISPEGVREEHMEEARKVSETHGVPLHEALYYVLLKEKKPSVEIWEVTSIGEKNRETNMQVLWGGNVFTSLHGYFRIHKYSKLLRLPPEEFREILETVNRYELRGHNVLSAYMYIRDKHETNLRDFLFFLRDNRDEIDEYLGSGLTLREAVYSVILGRRYSIPTRGERRKDEKVKKGGDNEEIAKKILKDFNLPADRHFRGVVVSLLSKHHPDEVKDILLESKELVEQFGEGVGKMYAHLGILYSAHGPRAVVEHVLEHLVKGEDRGEINENRLGHDNVKYLMLLGADLVREMRRIKTLHGLRTLGRVLELLRELEGESNKNT